MKKTALIFLTVSGIADFVINRKLSNAQVDSREVTLIAIMDEDDIRMACRDYNAELLSPTSRSESR